jgi:chromosome partitioning protein
MATVITFANQKGGVSKTTSALTIGQRLKFAKMRILLVDMDPQGNLSHSLILDHKKNTIWDVLTKEKTVIQAKQTNKWGDCLCFSPELTGADKKLDVIGKEYLLKEALDAVLDNYDYIIIDPPPTLGVLTINSLVVKKNFVVIPSQADMYSMVGISQLIMTIDLVKKYHNPELTVLGILLSRFNNRTNFSLKISQMLEETAIKLKTKVFSTRIRECTAIKEATACRTSIFDYSPKINAAIDYNSFYNELIGDINAKKWI